MIQQLALVAAGAAIAMLFVNLYEGHLAKRKPKTPIPPPLDPCTIRIGGATGRNRRQFKAGRIHNTSERKYERLIKLRGNLTTPRLSVESGELQQLILLALYAQRFKHGAAGTF